TCWLAVLAALAVASLTIFALAYFSPFSAWNLQLEFAIADEVWLQEYIWSCIGSFLQQGQDFYPYAMSPRAVMVFWWLFTVIIYGAYTGDLTSALTVSVTSLPIQSFEDMLADGSLTPIMPRGTRSTMYSGCAVGRVQADHGPDAAG
uniref:PBPe domain-containing protein n=1 Tax=Macrostomum lignano TaxID=282301 RepID=A0A1I8I790_9PLAT